MTMGIAPIQVLHNNNNALQPYTRLFFKQFPCWSDWQWPCLVCPFNGDRRLLPCSTLRFSPPGDRWCDVLGFIPAGILSNSSTLQTFLGACHLWWLLCQPVYLLGHSLDSSECHLCWYYCDGNNTRNISISVASCQCCRLTTPGLSHIQAHDGGHWISGYRSLGW